MSKVKEITFALKRGIKNFSSVFASETRIIEDGDDIDAVWDEMKQEVDKRCNEDPSWIEKKQPNEKGGERV